jgi:hypothetical protein
MLLNVTSLQAAVRRPIVVLCPGLWLLLLPRSMYPPHLPQTPMPCFQTMGQASVPFSLLNSLHLEQKPRMSTHLTPCPEVVSAHAQQPCPPSGRRHGDPTAINAGNAKLYERVSL